jgi:hypothetical protein
MHTRTPYSLSVYHAYKFYVYQFLHCVEVHRPLTLKHIATDNQDRPPKNLKHSKTKKQADIISNMPKQLFSHFPFKVRFANA